MRTKAEIIADLQDIENALSPENLHCDGEISKAEANRKYRALQLKRKALVAELGHEPTAADLFPEMFV